MSQGWHRREIEGVRVFDLPTLPPLSPARGEKVGALHATYSTSGEESSLQVEELVVKPCPGRRVILSSDIPQSGQLTPTTTA